MERTDQFGADLMIIAEERVYARIGVSHDVGLFDLDAKYADVIPTDSVIERLRAQLPPTT